MSECSACRDFVIRVADCPGATRRTPLERVQFAANALVLYRELHGEHDCEDGGAVMARVLGIALCAKCGGDADADATEHDGACVCHQMRTT